MRKSFKKFAKVIQLHKFDYSNTFFKQKYGIKYSTEKTNFRQFDHTACEKRNNHSQREHGLYWIITG